MILASASPRRKELLKCLDVGFEVMPADVDECLVAGEDVRNYVMRMAREKGQSIARSNPSRYVLSADTIVFLPDLAADKLETVLGKPEDVEDARRMLRLIEGREHFVITAFCILNLEGKVEICKFVETKVVFRSLSEKEIGAYVETGEPLGKAGAYAIQGIGAKLVSRIEGSYTNVVGLPLAELVVELYGLGLMDE